MKFSLKSYTDCGKCSYATLMDEFDTEKDEIRLGGKKVEINTLEDLFPFLWNIPGVRVRDNVSNKSVADFGSTGTWWEHRYGESIEDSEKEIKKLEKRLAKATETNKPKIQARIEYENKNIASLRRIIEWNNETMNECKEKLRNDNQ